IEFGGCPNPGDEQKYRGRPHDLLVFDEADQFPQHVVTFISGWLRTTILNQRCRMVLCFNPPSTAEGEWLLSYFGPWVTTRTRNPPSRARSVGMRWWTAGKSRGRTARSLSIRARRSGLSHGRSSPPGCSITPT